MADYNNITFYSGAGYGISGYNEPFINTKYRFAPSEFGLPTDPRTANQIKAVSDKLSTGARVIEVSGVSMSNFLRSALGSLKGEKISLFKFKDMLCEKAEILGVDIKWEL